MGQRGKEVASRERRQVGAAYYGLPQPASAVADAPQTSAASHVPQMSDGHGPEKLQQAIRHCKRTDSSKVRDRQRLTLRGDLAAALIQRLPSFLRSV